MTGLKRKFNDAVDYVKHAEGDFKPSNDLKLEMYALYKQATEGDVKGKKPGMMDPVGKAKYRAWGNLKGVSTERAMQSYIDTIDLSRQ